MSNLQNCLEHMDSVVPCYRGSFSLSPHYWRCNSLDFLLKHLLGLYVGDPHALFSSTLMAPRTALFNLRSILQHQPHSWRHCWRLEKSIRLSSSADRWYLQLGLCLLNPPLGSTRPAKAPFFALSRCHPAACIRAITKTNQSSLDSSFTLN